MDDVEPVELDEESLEGYGPRAQVSIHIQFKSGTVRDLKFEVPVWTPIYGEPLTHTTIYDLIASSYSIDETPFLALPDGSGQFFVDLGSTDYMTIEVETLE